MNWVYDRVARHGSVNYHIWRANDDGSTVYALTRTSALAPKNVASYRSMQEVFWRTGVAIEADSEEILQPYRPQPKPAKGILRKPDGWAEVDYGHRTGEVPRDLYEKRGYLPAFKDLPLDTTSREPIPHFAYSERAQARA